MGYDGDGRFFRGLDDLGKRAVARLLDAGFRIGRRLLRIGVGFGLGRVDLAVDALTVFLGQRMRAVARFAERLLIVSLRRFGVLAVRFGGREIARHLAFARGDGAADARACHAPQNDEQERKRNREPEDLVLERLRLERRKAAARRRLARSRRVACSFSS